MATCAADRMIVFIAAASALVFFKLGILFDKDVAIEQNSNQSTLCVRNFDFALICDRPGEDSEGKRGKWSLLWSSSRVRYNSLGR